jgi:hypothetical protein
MECFENRIRMQWSSRTVAKKSFDEPVPCHRPSEEIISDILS